MSSSRPNPASPWVIDTRNLGRRPGTMKRVTLSLPVREPIGLDVLSVPAGSSAELDIRLESVVEGVLISGTLTATASGECSRCLTEITEPIETEIRELYAYPDSTTAATTDEDEIPRLIDELIDVEPLARDEILLALPLAPLCRPDCAGLCAGCGERLDDLEVGHSHEILDSRWAALREKFGVEPESIEQGAPVDGQVLDLSGRSSNTANWTSITRTEE